MKVLKSLALLSIAAPLLLMAEGEEHVAIGSRLPSQEATAQIEAEKGMEPCEEETLETAGYLFDRYPPVYYSQSHHWLVAVTLLDNSEYTLELEDGAVWKIGSYDGFKALSWRANDPLTITQNTRWFSKHAYRIINKADGSTVEATLYLGPVADGQYSRYITAIDPSLGLISLSDNTQWEISPYDRAIFKDWAPHDYLIIGTNSNQSFWDQTREALLINVNMNNATRARQF